MLQEANSTSYANAAEVAEVVDRVAELRRNWPPDWGERDQTEVRPKKIDHFKERCLYSISLY